MQRRISHKDIAEKIGVDKSTVSLALSGHPRISAATVRRVKEAARQLGYRPDPLRALLARDRWSGHLCETGIGIAYFVHSGMPQAHLHWKFFEAARARALERGYVLTEFDLASYPNQRGLARVLNVRGIRGVLLPQFSRDPGVGRMLTEQDDFAVICLDNGRWRLPFHHVSPNVLSATRMMWREAQRRGYRRIGAAILTHDPPAIDDWSRLGGSLIAQAELLGRNGKLPLLRSSLEDFPSFKRWFLKHQPDAVIGILPLVHDWLVRAGVRVPEDVGFASLIVDLKEPRHALYAGYTAHDDAVAAAGVDALISAIQSNETGLPQLYHELLVDPIWHEGSTLPDRQANS
jgi:LacI family transcriptional regulator